MASEPRPAPGCAAEPGVPSRVIWGIFVLGAGPEPDPGPVVGGRVVGGLPRLAPARAPCLKMPPLGAGSRARAGDKLLHLAPVTCHAGERS